jgi:hypothetical protein
MIFPGPASIAEPVPAKHDSAYRRTRQENPDCPTTRAAQPGLLASAAASITPFASTTRRTSRMIRELRTLGYEVQPLSVQTDNCASRKFGKASFSMSWFWVALSRHGCVKRDDRENAGDETSQRGTIATCTFLRLKHQRMGRCVTTSAECSLNRPSFRDCSSFLHT